MNLLIGLHHAERDGYFCERLRFFLGGAVPLAYQIHSARSLPTYSMVRALWRSFSGLLLNGCFSIESWLQGLIKSTIRYPPTRSTGMTEILVAILIAWAVITILGHASWVIARSCIRVLFPSPDSSTPGPPSHDSRSPANRHERRLRDLAAFDKVLDDLVQAGHVNAAEAAKLSQMATSQWSVLLPDNTEDTCDSHESDREELESVGAPAGDDPAEPSPIPGVAHVSERPIMATLADTDEDRPRHDEPAAVAVGAEPETRRTKTSSFSELIHAFLAAHNIRWGELVAGLLIVICSIGLVISLWSTLTTTHRVVPSLIFLAGNASIFAAGLYTLSRWKLRHTSRAVLVIATLLVPLSVLSGIAAAGPTQDAVQLTDPITIATIVVAMVVYGALLLKSGRALIGRVHNWSYLTAVAGPIVSMPLLPTIIRSWSGSAGWVALVGSSTLAASLIRQQRLATRKHITDESTIRPLPAKHNLLVMALGAFSLAVLVGYVAFSVRSWQVDGWLPLTMALIPALVTTAAASRWWSVHAEHSVWTLVYAVVATLSLLVGLVLLVPSMHDAAWVWCWGILMTSGGLLCVFGLRSWTDLGIATVPVGVAAALTSPSWLGARTWSQIPWWGHFVGGEPMLVAACVGTVLAIGGLCLRQQAIRKSLLLVSTGWLGVAFVDAAVLSIGPKAWIGSMPHWSPTVVLGIAAIAAVLVSLHDRRGAYVAMFAALMTSVSILRPHEFSWSLDSPIWHVWTESLVATVGVLVLASELCRCAFALSNGTSA